MHNERKTTMDELMDYAKSHGIEKGMTWVQVASRYFGISEMEAEAIDPCDLFEEDEIAISTIWHEMN